MTEPSPLDAAQKLLIGAAMGSCTCNTKSPELIWHAPDCRYVAITAALENVEIAITAANEEQGPPNWRTWNGAVLDAGERQVADPGERKLPLQYEDGPDFCTVRDAQGRDFALTMQPDLMRAMEKALSDEAAGFMEAQPTYQEIAGGYADRWRLSEASLAIAVETLRSIHGRLWRDNEPYDERIGDLKSLALAALTAVAKIHSR